MQVHTSIVLVSINSDILSLYRRTYSSVGNNSPPSDWYDTWFKVNIIRTYSFSYVRWYTWWASINCSHFMTPFYTGNTENCSWKTNILFICVKYQPNLHCSTTVLLKELPLLFSCLGSSLSVCLVPHIVSTRTCTYTGTNWFLGYVTIVVCLSGRCDFQTKCISHLKGIPGCLQ